MNDGHFAAAEAIDDVPAAHGMDAASPAASAAPQREHVTSVRFFNGNIHRVAVLCTAEFAMTALLAYVAILAIPSPGPLHAMSAWIPAISWAFMAACAYGSMGLYQLRHRVSYRGIVARLVVATLLTATAIEFAVFCSRGLDVGASTLLAAAVFSLCGSAVLRYFFLQLVDEDVFKRRVVVWGAGMRAANISARMRRRVDRRGFRIVAHVQAPGEPVVIDQPVQQPDENLLHYLVRHRIEEIVVAMDDRRQGFPADFLRECRFRGIAVTDLLTFLERETGRVSVELASPSWLIFSGGFRADVLRLATKRLFDVAMASILLVSTAPFWALAALAIVIEDRGPIFYRQIRTGQRGRPFSILKFRSMSVNAEANGAAVWAQQNDPRVTRVGAFIRKTRIDELPQVLNVLVGQMSFVGPRPERPAFVQKLAQAIPFYDERHFVKPGITGWAQVRYAYGASEADAREKLGYDLFYVKNYSLAFDMSILLQTVETVVFRLGSR